MNRPLFILIQGQRIRISTIKRYSDSGENQITMWFNTNRYKMDSITFHNLSTVEKELVLHTLDYYLL